MIREVLTPALRLVVVATLVALAAADLGTAWFAVAWLDPSQVPLWAWSLWLLRGAAFAAAARAAWASSGLPSARLLAVVGLLLLLPTISPLRGLDTEDSARFRLGVTALLLAAVAGGLASRRRRA